jgi:enoyl-CoA hydratase/carnithine racemase
MADIAVERLDGVVTLTLDQPQRRNAMSENMWEKLFDELAVIDGTASDRVLILTGRGDAFCSGSDMRSPIRQTESPEIRMQRANRAVAALHSLRKPTIAKVRGCSVGGGAQLALACDLVVASDDAYFSELFVSIGLSLDVGGSWLLPRIVGLQRAKRLALLSERLDASSAAAMGLISHVVASAELDRQVALIATTLTEASSQAVLATKLLLNNSFERTFSEALAAEAAFQVLNETNSGGSAAERDALD